MSSPVDSSSMNTAVPDIAVDVSMKISLIAVPKFLTAPMATSVLKNTRYVVLKYA